MNAEVVVLGSGTSSGVPTLGFEYPESFLANPKNHRSRPSILFRTELGNVLVDCAPEMRLQLFQEGVLSVECVIVTHGHADHIMGMDDLRGYSLKSGRAVLVYANEETQEDIRRVFPYAFEPPPPGVMLPNFDVRPVPDVVRAAGLEIQTFPLVHGRWTVTGLRCRDFAYLTDVNLIPDESWAFLDGLETLVLDAVRYKPHPNHFNFEQAMDVARRIGARTTYFTHLSHDYDHDAVEATMPPNIRLAYDGLRIPL